jgi:hypothetical protein
MLLVNILLITFIRNNYKRDIAKTMLEEDHGAPASEGPIDKKN